MSITIGSYPFGRITRNIAQIARAVYHFLI